MSKPTAIITSLEDCPLWLDRTLLNAYREAEYFLQPILFPDQAPLLFSFGRPFSDLQYELEQADIQNFVILTAFNPGSQALSPEENLQRHELLRVQLMPMCRLLRDSVSQSSEGEWREKGFWALDVDLEKAVDLGRAFGQNALVGWEKGAEPGLWWL